MKRVGEIALIGWLAGTQLLVAGATAPNFFLLEAIRNGDIKAVRRSIQKGIEINTRDDRGNTALHLAALNLDVARLPCSSKLEETLTRRIFGATHR